MSIIKNGDGGRKRVVLFNWRDLSHPKAGGAEVYTHDLLRTLAEQGFDCTLFASAYAGLPTEERNEYYRIIRRGSELSCRFAALQWLWKNRGKFDFVIDEVNTIPFLSPLVPGENVVLLMHQLAREVWWKEAPRFVAPFGFAAEPLVLQLYRHKPLITISTSSASSIQKLGLGRNSFVVECVLAPPAPIEDVRHEPFLIGYVGRVTPSKQIDHIIRAFAVALGIVPQARLVIVGGGSAEYMQMLHELASDLGVSQCVSFKGRVSEDERDALMASLDCLVMASVREGWGLVVSEAARYRVPTVAYDTHGVRDAVINGVTGILVPQNRWNSLGEELATLLLNPQIRRKMGDAASENLSRYSRDVFRRKVHSLVDTIRPH